MECHRALTLVVLTLLQLCRAEINDVQPQWYSANVINDGFQPKSISELFSSDPPFSTANPIVVSSVNSNDDTIRMLSSLPPPSSLSSSSTGYTQSSTPFPSSLSTDYSSSQSPVTQFSSTQTPMEQFMTHETESVEVRPIEPRGKSMQEPQRNIEIQKDQTASTQTLPPNPPTIKYTTFSQPIDMTPQDLRVELVPQHQTSISPSSFQPQTIPLSNYFPTYQQVPDQGYTNPSSPIPTLGDQTYSTATPLTSTFPSTFSSPPPTYSTISPSPITTSPLFSTTTFPPVTHNLKTSTMPRVTVTSSSSIGITRNMGSSQNIVGNCNISTTPIPRTRNPVAFPVNPLFPLKISVRGPSGSITHVNFNPMVKPAPTPKPRPPKTTTTRKPTTKRTPKPKKNTYERCLQGCRKNGQNVCAAPLSQAPVDPKTLRGFPSVCHMACHNSYRKDPYEKVTDGTCSRLRTRIRPVDSNTKLKKDELHKVQYFLDNGGPQAIVEVSGTYS